MMDYVFVRRNVIGWLLDIRVLRGERSCISNPFLVKRKLKINR